MTKKSFKPFDIDEAIRNGDPRFVTIFDPTMTACCIPRPVDTVEEARSWVECEAMMWMGLPPLPDEESDESQANPEIVEKFGDWLPLRCEFWHLKGSNDDWQAWVDVDGRWFYKHVNTGEMKWDIDQDHPAFPVLHRDSEKSHGVARKYGEQLPKKLDWRWREWGQKWELWLDVGRIYLVDIEKGDTQMTTSPSNVVHHDLNGKALVEDIKTEEAENGFDMKLPIRSRIQG